jgi:hypothetical protein
MRTFIRTIIALLVCAAMPALAAGQVQEEGSIMMVLFLGFGALIIVSQLFPGVSLFAVMLKEIITGSRKKAAVAATDKAAK